MARVFALTLTAGSIVWALAIVATPARRESSTSRAAYGFAAVVCHQRPDRSFTLFQSQMPVCARCAGLYASGALAAGLAWLAPRRAPRRSRELLLIAAIPTAATIPIEWSGMSALSNAIRMAAALPLGAAAGWTFVRALRSEDVGL